MAIRRVSGSEILLHFRWGVAGGALTAPALAKLTPYITRYAETLNVRVIAVGGVSDHLHVLADIPPEMPADQFARDLLPPTARYLRDVGGVRSFAWDAAGVSVVSVSPGERAAVAAYLAEQEARHAAGDLEPAYEGGAAAVVAAAGGEDELPGWLAEAMKRG